MAGAAYRKGMVLEPVLQPETEQRLCVLLDDVETRPVRVKVAHRDRDGRILLTDQEFLVPPSALQMLRPVAGLCYDF